MVSLRSSARQWLRRVERGSVLIETAFVLPVLLVMALGVIGVGRVIQADVGIMAVAREAARSAAMANDANEAVSRGLARGQDVARGYQLTDGSLQLAVDPGSFERGGQVTAQAGYTVQLGDLPLLHWARLRLHSRHTEAIDPYRSRWPVGGRT